MLKTLAELGSVAILLLIPRNEVSGLDPAIVSREFAAKRQEEVLKRELITMLAPVHVENSERLVGRNEPIQTYYITKNCSDPLQRS